MDFCVIARSRPFTDGQISLEVTTIQDLETWLEKAVGGYITVTFTLFQVYHVISAKCYTLHSKNALFDTLDITVIK